MTLRELEHLRSIRAQISAEDEKITRLRSRAERLTQVMTGMPHGGQREELADIIAQIVDMEAKAGRRVIELERECEAAMEDMKLIVDAVREEHCDETCCFACKFDCDTSITDSGCYANECPGFERDDCFEWRGPVAGEESR